MKLALAFLTLALSAFAADAPAPTPNAPPAAAISDAHQAAFERARANEAESRIAHDADSASVQKRVAHDIDTLSLQAAYAVLVADCGKDQHPERPDRDKPVTCVANPPGPEAKK